MRLILFNFINFILKFFKLNKIWASKENKLKSFYEKEINKVKRYYSSMVSSSDIQAKKTISRLQSQLKTIKENKENALESKQLLFPYEQIRKTYLKQKNKDYEK